MVMNGIILSFALFTRVMYQARRLNKRRHSEATLAEFEYSELGKGEVSITNDW